MPGLNLHQYWRRPVATCTGLPKAIPFERLDPPVPVANSGTMYLFCFIVSHLVCTSVARSTPESRLGPHGLQNRCARGSDFELKCVSWVWARFFKLRFELQKSDRFVKPVLR